jgi:hypothetical protein
VRSASPVAPPSRTRRQPKRRLVASALRSPPNLWREAGYTRPARKQPRKGMTKLRPIFKALLLCLPLTSARAQKADTLAPIAEERHVLWNGVYLSGTGRMFVNYPMITPRPHSSVAEVNQAGVGNPLLARSGIPGIRANLLRQLSLAPMMCASVQREICGSCRISG